jgi:hypothetical protein
VKQKQKLILPHTRQVTAHIVGVEANQVTQAAWQKEAAQLIRHHLINRTVEDAELWNESPFNQFKY